MTPKVFLLLLHALRRKPDVRCGIHQGLQGGQDLRPSPKRYTSRDHLLDPVIAHGWIDGRMRKLDAERKMQLISPRKQQIWSLTYIDRATSPEPEGRMKPAGRWVMLRNQNSGLWDAMAEVDALNVSYDLDTALEAGGQRTGGVVRRIGGVVQRHPTDATTCAGSPL